MTGTRLRFGEERGRVAVRVHDEKPVVDAKAPLRCAGTAEDLDAAADVLGKEALEPYRLRVVTELLGWLTRLQREDAGSGGHVERKPLPLSAVQEPDEVPEVVPGVWHLDRQD